MIRIFLVALGLLCLGIFSAFAIAWWQQDRIVFHPASYPENQQLPDTGSFLSFDNPRLVAWERKIPADPGAPLANKITLLFLHGAGHPLDPKAFWVRRFNHPGLSLVLPEYPGFPRTSAIGADKLSIEDTIEDVTEICRTLRKERPDEALIVVGYSLGGHIGMRLPEDCQDGLITMATLKDTKDMGPFKLGRFIAGRYDATPNLTNRKKPIVVFHAPEDSVVPYQEKLKILEALEGNAALVAHHDMPGVDHYTNSHRLAHDVMQGLIDLGYDVQPYERMQ